MSPNSTILIAVDKSGFIIDNAHLPTKIGGILSVYNATLSTTCDFETQFVSNPDACEFIICDSKSISKYLNTKSMTLVAFHFTQISTCSTTRIHDYIKDYVLVSAEQIDNPENIHMLQYNKTDDKHPERKYGDLLFKILDEGIERPDRTGTGTVSLFGEQIKFDISHCIPIITTKYIPYRLVIEELLWFMRGDTDSKQLEEKGVNIWKGNSSREFLEKRGLGHLPEGDIGCGYGFQWRHFGGEYINCKTQYSSSVGFDQLEDIVRQLKNDPYSRRILMSAWNAKDLCGMALPPCHNQVQFYVTPPKSSADKPRLSCHMYQRSVDTFLGFPWNILSYTVLTYILATKCDMVPAELIISTGDTHVYKDHIEQVQQQLQRFPIPWPMLKISKDVKDKDWNDISFNDFKLMGYFSHPTIKANMSV